jgi:hypothetical protein
MSDTTQPAGEMITMSAERYQRATICIESALGTLGLVCEHFNGRTRAEQALEGARLLFEEAYEALRYWKDRPGYVETEAERAERQRM